jgi:hypothetical protein
VNDWSVVFLGIIAVATLVMALIQVGAIVATIKLVREAQKVVVSVQQDIRPLIARATAIADEAGKAAALATAQAEKVDRLVTTLTQRVDETANIVQQAIVTPAREGMAIVAAIKASLGALKGFRGYRGASGQHGEDDDALFIG